MSAPKKKKVAQKAKTKPAKEPRETISALVRSEFESNPDVSNAELVDLVTKQFPDSKFNPVHASYYRNRLRADGMDIPRAVRQKKEKPKAKAKAKGKAKGKAKAKLATNDDGDGE
jgi:hypothetical protein